MDIGSHMAMPPPGFPLQSAGTRHFSVHASCSLPCSLSERPLWDALWSSTARQGGRATPLPLDLDLKAHKGVPAPFVSCAPAEVEVETEQGGRVPRNDSPRLETHRVEELGARSRRGCVPG